MVGVDQSDCSIFQVIRFFKAVLMTVVPLSLLFFKSCVFYQKYRFACFFWPTLYIFLQKVMYLWNIKKKGYFKNEVISIKLVYFLFLMWLQIADFFVSFCFNLLGFNSFLIFVMFHLVLLFFKRRGSILVFLFFWNWQQNIRLINSSIPIRTIKV